MNSVVRYVKDLFFPPRCVFCDEVIPSSKNPVCPACEKAGIAFIGSPACARCGREKDACVCKKNTLLTDGIAAPYYYEETVRKGIHRFKKVEDIDRITYFSQQAVESMYRAFAEKKVDIITTVPPHKNDLTERGFDQLQPIANRISKESHVPYIPLLRKIFETEPQKELPADRRAGNLLGAFDVCSKVSLKNKNILLIDDVVTTGSTTNECAKMLKIYGAAHVYVLALALSRLKDKDDEDENDPIADLKKRLAGKAGDFT